MKPLPFTGMLQLDCKGTVSRCITACMVFTSPAALSSPHGGQAQASGLSRTAPTGSYTASKTSFLYSSYSMPVRFPKNLTKKSLFIPIL